MSNNRIKKALLMSSTMPPGTGGSDASWLMGAGHTHRSNADIGGAAHGSCCDNAHSHAKDEHAKGSCCDNSHDDAHDDDDHDECDGDHTDPRGGCC